MPRPKGYASWNFTSETGVVLTQIQEILDEYHDYLPMTARQVFYRLVGAYGFEKTERAYKRLCNYLVRARRAQLISFKDIRDDGVTQLDRYESVGSLTNFGGHDPASYIESIRELAEAYFRERMEPQAMRIEVWCEAAGMAPQLQRVTNDFGITVYSTGGFSSVTVTRQIAERALQSQKQTYLLHIGDHDPSGESLYEVMVLDARTFVWQLRTDRNNPMCDIVPMRVALTPDQIEEHDIPTSPPKSSDSRSVNWYDETAQAEAMPPDLLASTLLEAVEGIVDTDLLKETVEEEGEERDQIREKLESLEWDV